MSFLEVFNDSEANFFLIVLKSARYSFHKINPEVQNHFEYLRKNFQDKIDSILQIVRGSGIRLSRRKTFYKGNQSVTGIEVSLNKISAPEKILKKVEEEKSLPDGTTKPYTLYNDNIDTINNSKNR